MKKKLLLLLLLTANTALSTFGINKKPFTIPEVKEWKGQKERSFFRVALCAMVQKKGGLHSNWPTIIGRCSARHLPLPTARRRKATSC